MKLPKRYSKMSKDLVEYYNHYAFYVGFSSSYASVINEAHYGKVSTMYQDPYSDKMLKKINANRITYNTLKAIDIDHKRTLLATFDWQYINRYPGDVVEVFGDFAGAAMFVQFLTLKELTTLCRKSIQKKISQEDGLLLQAAKNSAENLLFVALSAYANERKNHVHG